MTTEATPIVETPADPKVDFGDDFTPAAEVAVTLPEDTPAAPVVEPNPMKDGEKAEDKAEEKAEDKAEEKAEDKAEDKEEDRPRGEDGKFLPKDKPVMIPKARFDEVNTKAKAKVAALEGQVKDLQSRLGLADGKAPDTKALQDEIKAKTAEYSKLIADGELDKASDVMGDILAANRKVSAAESAALANAHGREQQNVQTITELVDLFKTNFPVFDDKSADYNQDYVDYVAGLQDRFERTGSAPAEALREAVELAVAKFGLDVEPAPAPAADPKAKAEGDRAAAARAAAAAASTAQPPKLKTGLDSDKAGLSNIILSELKQEEFETLGDAQLSRLRGDFI